MRQSISCRDALVQIGSWAGARQLVCRHDPHTGFGAVFSRCDTWRYLLWRMHHPRGRLLGMGMLNPSTADELRDDPTIARCHRLAGKLGYPGLIVWNLFAYRATDPKALRQAADPVGPESDAAIDLALSLCHSTVLAWGNHGALGGRGGAVMARCMASDTRLSVLGTTRQAEPRHPLYLPGDVRPKRLRRHG